MLCRRATLSSRAAQHFPPRILFDAVALHSNTGELYLYRAIVQVIVWYHYLKLSHLAYDTATGKLGNVRRLTAPFFSFTLVIDIVPENIFTDSDASREDEPIKEILSQGHSKIA